MKNKKNTIMLIMIITISMVLLTWNKSYSYKMNDNEVEETEVERKEFGIYLEKNQGSSKQDNDYTETNTFPTQGYLLNTTKTECYEYGSDNVIQNAVEQSLTNGVIDGTIIVTSQKSMYCKIYFDKDDILPTVTGFTITGKDVNGSALNNGYTYNPEVTYNIIWQDNDVAQYCISEGANCTNWQQIAGTQATGVMPVSQIDGEKTLYVYLKDKANNTSEVKTENIIVDRTPPVVNTLTLTGTKASWFNVNPGFTHTTMVNYNATIIEANIEGYCIQEGSSCNTFTPTSLLTLNGQVQISNTETLHTVVISVQDKVGNIGIMTGTITLDATPPQVTVTEKSKTENSITVHIEATDTNGIQSRHCQLPIEPYTWILADANGDCTVTGLQPGIAYTILTHTYDGSGFVNEVTSSSISTMQAWTCSSGSVLTPSSLGSATGGYVCVKDGTRGDSYECECKYLDTCSSETVYHSTYDKDLSSALDAEKSLTDNGLGSRRCSWSSQSMKDCGSYYNCSVHRNGDADIMCYTIQPNGSGYTCRSAYHPYEEVCRTCYHYQCDADWLQFSGSLDSANLKCYKAPTRG